MTQDEKYIMKKFIEEYIEINKSIDLMQESIKELSNKRDSLFSKVEKLKRNETEFINKLSEKYGKDEIDPNNLLKKLYDEKNIK